MRWLILIAALAGCHRGDEALRYERGDGVPRDYTRAAQIYAQRCRHGDGDVAACRSLVLAVVRHRGAATIDFDARAVMQRACDRGEWASCIPPLAAADREKARAACDAGAPAACVAAVAVDAFSQSGTVEAEDHDRLVRACRANDVEACIDLTGPGRDPLVPELAEHLHRACTAGDADACAAAGTPIAPAELCRAHDFEACAAAGVLDPACDAGVGTACTELAVRARDADPPDPTASARMKRACEVGGVIHGHDACLDAKPAEVAIGCGAYWPRRIAPAERTHVAGSTGPAGKPFLLLRAQTPDPHDAPSPAAYTDLERRLAPDVALVMSTGDVTTVVDASGLARATLSFEEGLVPATLARCVRGLLAEP